MSTLLTWLEQDCPEDLVAKILAFAGPREISLLVQAAASLSADRQQQQQQQQHNPFWHDLMASESTWQVFCEEFQKWTPDEPEPTSWRDHYQTNLCVPAEYSSLDEALKVAMARSNDKDNHFQQEFRILLRPGVYGLHDTLVMNASCKITIQTMDGYSSTTTATSTTTTTTTTTSTLNDAQLLPQPQLQQNPNDTRAYIMLKTTNRNHPVIHVQQGALHLKNVKLSHSCFGNDFFRGNAALHIQPSRYHNNLASRITSSSSSSSSSSSPNLFLPSLSLDRVEVTSYSGQGVMNYLGGDVSIQNSYIHDCAATGVFIEAPRCNVLIHQTDIMANGHAGVHLELGQTASIVDCGIVGNSSIGVSVFEMSLCLELSDVVANGYQLETERPPKRLCQNNFTNFFWASSDGKEEVTHIVVEDEESDLHHRPQHNNLDNQHQQREGRILTRTAMARSNFIQHLSKAARLLNNRRIR